MAAATAFAQEPSQNIQFSAFGTIGVATTDTNKVGFRRDSTQFDGITNKASWNLDSRYGVQASAKLSSTLLATVQVVSSYRFDGTYKPEVTIAALHWSPVENLQTRIGIITIPMGLADQSLDVGYASLWARPPIEVFGVTPISRVRGVDVIRTFSLGSSATLEARAFYGNTAVKVPIDHVGAWDLTGGRAYGGAVKLFAGALQARISGAYFRNNSPFPEAITTFQAGLQTLAFTLHDPQLNQAAADLKVQGTGNWGMLAEVAWEEGPWQVEGLLGRSRSNAYLYPDDWHGLASVGYRVGQVVPYCAFSRVVSTRPARPDLGILDHAQGPLAPVAQLVASSLYSITDARGLDQHTLSAGLRWDFAPKMDLKVQVDSIRAHNSTALQYNPDLADKPGWNGRMTVFSVVLDFIIGGGR